MNEPTIDDLLKDAFVGIYTRNEDGNFVPMDDKYNVLRAYLKKDLEQYVLRQVIAELEYMLKTVKPQDKHAGASWIRGYISSQMKLRKTIKDRIKTLQAKLIKEKEL